MNKKQQKYTADLIVAALRTADLAKKHLEHEEKKTVLLQEAAQDARDGNMALAHNKRYRVDVLSATTVFDYTGVFKALDTAAQRYRKTCKYCPYCNGAASACKYCGKIGTLDAACVK